MTCPRCGSRTTRVYNSRHHTGGVVRRNRSCLTCGFRFSTEERQAT